MTITIKVGPSAFSKKGTPNTSSLLMFEKLNDPCFDFSSEGESVDDEDADSDFRG